MHRDETLRQYCTDRQWEVLESLWEHGSERKAAKALGVHKSAIGQAKKAVLKKAAQHGWAPEYDLTHELPDGLALRGTSIRYDNQGKIQQYWNKSRLEGRDPEEVFHLPDPKKVVKVSTLYDQMGQVSQQWIAEKPEDIVREALWRQFAKDLAEDLPKADKTPAPKQPLASDLMACYPVGDHHNGQLSWHEETGEDYDLTIAEARLKGAIDHLVGVTPACEVAALIFLGDLLHYDSFEAITPTNKNRLDPDSRYPKMVRVALRGVRYSIQKSLQKHQKVHVIIEIGNHDLATSIFMMEALAAIYENEPRVVIDTSPRHFHYFDFGNNLVGTHHGHGVKFEKLPLIMATDKPEEWGRTKYRYWWTGHVHHDQVKDYEGCRVESFRVLAPTDAWAASKGYRPMADMKAIVLHKEFGEVARHIVNPAMMGS